jgi:PAS domain S-box-containing protein
MLGFLVFAGAIIALGESNRRASASRFRLAALVDWSDDAILSKDLDGIIMSWNRGAQRLFGWTEQEAIGQPVTILIPPELHKEESEILKQIRAGKPIERFETVRHTKTGEKIDVSLTISPVKDSTGRIIGASKIAHNITERKQMEANLKNANDALEDRVKQRTAELVGMNEELVSQADLVRDLSARLLQLQDEERRHIARELHDSVGQLLAAISMNISKIAREKAKLSPAAEKSAEENASLVEQALTEIRTMSHLLHPPLLDEIGLESAIKWYTEGFAQRSKIEVALDLPPDLGRLSSDLEIALFRVMQECLTNIHRHSGSTKAAIRFAQKQTSLELEVSDEGKGIPIEKQRTLNASGALGVGFRGMRERVRQLGGTLQIHSNGNGTKVSVTLPMRNAKASSATDSFG